MEAESGVGAVERKMSCLDPEVVTLQMLQTTDDLRAFEQEWIRLWEADPHATPFQHPGWLLPWWNHFGQPALRAAAVWRGETLLAFLPFYILQDGVTNERQLLLIGAGTSDYLDGLFARDCTPDDVLYALEVLLAEPGWDVAHFTQLVPHSKLFQAIQRLRSSVEVRPYEGEECSRCPAVTISELPAKIRSDVRYYRNYAIGRGTLDLKTSSASECEKSFDLLVRFHTERWEQAGEAGVLADPAVLAWHREALSCLEASGLLRLLVLKLGGEPIAVLYSLVDSPDPPSRTERTQYFYLMGFSLAHAELRPGVLLTALAIEGAAMDGVRTIDMLRGQEVYKQFWRVQPVRTHGFAVRRFAIRREECASS